MISVVRWGLLGSCEAFYIRDLRFKDFASDSIYCDIELVNGEVEAMTLNRDLLSAVRAAFCLIYIINLGNGLSFVAPLILIVTSGGVIIKKLSVSCAEPKHYIRAVAGLDCTHLASNCISLIGIEDSILLDKCFKFNSITI
jgi:hypothetical protein